ncbi:hypothetical protein LQ772_06570 [Frateuria edaphi]|uniref:hypothetical protein n=1 Tax=Frateuria edaphi TaxID=2898793 RepID=UPI001E651AEF|nr:hypothetical protein [Frateuria edaphi]UGB46949.1 hypothetical protein LQ772_06570 [Frateuria edaphi]
MSIQHIRSGYLLAQENEEHGVVEHSIVVQQYEGGISIAQGREDIYVDDDRDVKKAREAKEA